MKLKIILPLALFLLATGSDCVPVLGWLPIAEAKTESAETTELRVCEWVRTTEIYIARRNDLTWRVPYLRALCECFASLGMREDEFSLSRAES